MLLKMVEEKSLSIDQVYFHFEMHQTYELHWNDAKYCVLYYLIEIFRKWQSHFSLAPCTILPVACVALIASIIVESFRSEFASFLLTLFASTSNFRLRLSIIAKIDTWISIFLTCTAHSSVRRPLFSTHFTVCFCATTQLTVIEMLCFNILCYSIKTSPLVIERERKSQKDRNRKKILVIRRVVAYQASVSLYLILMIPSLHTRLFPASSSFCCCLLCMWKYVWVNAFGLLVVRGPKYSAHFNIVTAVDLHKNTEHYKNAYMRHVSAVVRPFFCHCRCCFRCVCATIL